MDNWISVVALVALVVVMVFIGALVVLKRLGLAFESLNNGVFFYGQGDNEEGL